MARRPLAAITLALALGLASSAPASARTPFDWPGYGRDPQHTAVATVAAQRPLRIRWTTPVDLDPQYWGSLLLIHYGSPLVTRRNTVVVTVKTGTTDGFRFDGRRGDTGALVWSEPTDYSLPPHNWVPSVGPVLARGRVLLFPGAGGTVLRRSRPDRATGTLRRYAFYGVANWQADPAAFEATVKVTTPLVADRRGNVFFGFTTFGGGIL